MELSEKYIGQEVLVKASPNNFYNIKTSSIVGVDSTVGMYRLRYHTSMHRGSRLTKISKNTVIFMKPGLIRLNNKFTEYSIWN